LQNCDSRKINECRSCRGTSLFPVHESIPVPVAGIYYDLDGPPTEIYAPLTLVCCQECGLIQLAETISPDIYSDYSFVGDSAAAYQLHLESVADWLAEKWDVSGKSVFEVGASNGVLLGYLSKKYRNEVSGIEPSRKLCDSAASSGIGIECGYFNSGFLAQAEIGPFDCVIIRHVLEHIDDLEDMLQSLQRIVKSDGLLVVEVPDGGKIFQNRLFSNVFHEHLNYFTQSSLDNLMSRHGFSPIATEEVDVHGGALLLVYKSGITKASSTQAIDHDLLKRFSRESDRYYQALHDRIQAARQSGKVVHGYGASHRTFILLGNAGLDRYGVPVIYDNNPMLHGKRLNGFHIEVRPVRQIKDDSPDAIVVFATSYETEIRALLADECGYRGEIISVRHEELCEEDQQEN
jgi:SAM-dependent methyltransferase